MRFTCRMAQMAIYRRIPMPTSKAAAAHGVSSAPGLMLPRKTPDFPAAAELRASRRGNAPGRSERRSGPRAGPGQCRPPTWLGLGSWWSPWMAPRSGQAAAAPRCTGSATAPAAGGGVAALHLAAELPSPLCGPSLSAGRWRRSGEQDPVHRSRAGRGLPGLSRTAIRRLRGARSGRAPKERAWIRMLSQAPVSRSATSAITADATR